MTYPSHPKEHSTMQIILQSTWQNSITCELMSQLQIISVNSF